ncbi:MAG: DUF3737 family protein [Bacteroidales bacterium]|nr:DUF3737 family protein [Bacteroidales bacterium]
MELIKNKEFSGERPLYCRRGLRLENVTIHAGESALKETADIEAAGCRFEGKYPFWCCDGFTVSDCVFTEGARAALWYSRGLVMEDTLVEAPKMFREMSDLVLRRVRIPNAAETLWSCRGVELDDVEIDKGDYLFMHSSNIRIKGLKLQGNYSFQYCKNVEIHDSVLHTKDAFWETENVTVYDSVIIGEYLGWYSKGLRLVNCRIGGTQPLCYAEDLVLENCTFNPDADLAFEYSSVNADIRGGVTSVKNPRTGCIKASSIGEIILDENIKAPGDCNIVVSA